MEGQMRRDTIVKMLGEKGKPLSGTELAKELGVSRQVIVQDRALLRAQRMHRHFLHNHLTAHPQNFCKPCS